MYEYWAFQLRELFSADDTSFNAISFLIGWVRLASDDVPPVLGSGGLITGGGKTPGGDKTMGGGGNDVLPLPLWLLLTIVQAKLSPTGSRLPAASNARTRITCEPTGRFDTLNGFDGTTVQAPPSMLASTPSTATFSEVS